MVSGSKGHGVGFERCWTTARNQHARRSTPWRVVFCEKMKNQVRNAKDSRSAGSPTVENGTAAVGLGAAKMAIANPQAARAPTSDPRFRILP